MKKIFIIMISALVLLVSCQKEKPSSGLTGITYYVTFSFNGDQVTLLPVGTDYVEQGVVAMEGDEDVTDKVTISGSVDKNKLGLYYISYSAENKDGYSATAKRTVAVYNPAITTDISGNYTVQEGSHRLRGETVVPYNGYPIVVSQIAPGLFSIDDFLGAYYWKHVNDGAGYGKAYACSGTFSLNEDNTLSLISSSILPWGDTIEPELESTSYDPATKTITFTSVYSGMYFNVILK